jgi:HEAT repeat protein
VRLFDELKALDSTTNAEFNARKYTIIHDLAEAHFVEARSYFLAGLDNPDPDYRWACISALATHWKDTDPQLISKLTALTEHDPDAQVRMISAESLGRLQVYSALPTLKRIVENEQEGTQNRQTAYEAILRILNLSAEAFPVWADYDNFEDNRIDKGLLGTI